MAYNTDPWQKINNSVKNAVNSRDFSQLKDDILDAAEDMIYGPREGQTNNNAGGRQSGQSANTNNSSSNNSRQSYGNGQGRQNGADNSQQRRPQGPYGGQGFPAVRQPKGKGLGWAMMICGAGAIWMGLSMLGVFMQEMMFMPYRGLGAMLVFAILFCIAGAAAIVWGNSKRTRVNRYKDYLKLLWGRTFITFKDMAQLTGRSVSFIKKDFKKMLRLGYFPEGHIDSQNTCIMLNDAIYGQYLAMMKNQEVVRKESAAKKDTGEKAQEAPVDKEVSRLEAQGRKYREQIRKINDEIPDVEITNKLYRMESIIEKIFEYVQKHPEKADSLSRFEDYYMPMTIKLLESYKELDGQPIEGDNIKKMKSEIEQTLGTINEAYEKLYDSMFEDEAIDISSDISVLRTLLAQEGLTESELDRLRTADLHKTGEKV